MAGAIGTGLLEPIQASPIWFLLFLLLVVLGVSIYLGTTDRVSVRIGYRNFVRGRQRTLVLLLGLLVGTAIISSSLVVGDTVATLSTHFAYAMDGDVHEAIYAVGPTGNQPLPYAFYERLNTSASALSDVRGLTPIVLATGSFSGLDLNSGIPETGMNLVGVDANASAVLGYFTTLSGATLSGPTAKEVLLNPTAAQELDASSGDHLDLATTGGRTISVTVLAVVSGEGRGGFQDLGSGDVFTTLFDAQYLMNTPGEINYIAVTNVGGASGGIAHTSSVLSELNATLPMVKAAFPAGALPGNVQTHDVLDRDVRQAAREASDMETFFLVVGLFSIVSGSLLVVGTFVLLSEERRGQMGVARAIGMTRGQLIRSYYFEGLAYAAGSALLGTFVGVGIAFALLEEMGNTFGSSLVPSQAILSSFTLLPSSLLAAYVLGFLITLGTMAATVAYVGRMNIVRAIRNVPEPPLTRRSYSRIGLTGVAMVALGLNLLYLGLPHSVDIDVALLGISLAILGAGLAATAFLPNRLTMTVTALALILFWGDYPLRRALFGSDHPGFIFIFFQEGVFLILAAILLYLFNADLVMRGLRSLIGRSPRQVPVVTVALSYPAHKRFRTAITLAIFAMVLFTIVAVSSIRNGVASSVDQRVQAQSGGYTMAGFSTRPIPDLPAEISRNVTLSGEFSTVVPFYSAEASINATGTTSRESFTSMIAAAPLGLPPAEDFYTSNHYNFSAAENGSSAQRVWQKLKDDPSGAVVSGDHLRGAFTFARSGPPLSLGEILNITMPGMGTTLHVHIVGILAESMLSVILLNPSAMTGTLRVNQTALFLLGTPAGASAQQAIYDLKRAFFLYGLQLLDFQQVFTSALQFLTAFLDLLEVFVAVGLVVGIAAIGILALRAVAERRSEIGMVRALGFRRGQVLSTFLTEYSFLALLGVGIGVANGVLLSYNLSQGASAFFAFAVPWTNIAMIVILSYALTLLATGGQSYHGSRIPPSQALRYSE